ncbi:hypothetical protein BBJ28_00014941, partial [Nothophytophthora sp. Chile5]
SEWGLLSGQFNPTKAFIDFCALIGQAYDLKRSRTASKTRERVMQEVRESRLKQGLSPAMSWWDRQMSQLFFGKSEAQIFHISSEVGMHLLGGKGLFLSSDDIQLGVNETLKDTALVLSRFNSIILARVYGHSDIEELGRLATVPVINALSDKYHPLQMLADYMTVKIAGTSVVMTTDPVEAVKNANVVSTDTWISCILLMGDKGGESKGGKNEVNPLKFIEQRVASAFPALVGPKFTAKYATEPNE